MGWFGQTDSREISGSVKYDNRAEMAQFMNSVARTVDNIAKAASLVGDAAVKSAKATEVLSENNSFLSREIISNHKEELKLIGSLRSTENEINILNRKIKHKNYIIVALFLVGLPSIGLNTIFLIRQAIGI